MSEEATMSEKRLKSVRIELPKGMYYEVLAAGAKLHGAPSMSKYILNAAMTYTKEWLDKKQAEIQEREATAKEIENE